MSSKKDYANKILKILGQKNAISVPEINEKITTPCLSRQANPLLNKDGAKYAITRALKNLHEAGLIEKISSPQNEYARLTNLGKKKVHCLELENDQTLVNTSWDGYWRIVLLNLPENRKAERESLVYLLKKANFVCLKNSVWISPFPFEHLFTNIKKDLNLGTEMMIIVTEFIDKETKDLLFETFAKQN